MTLTNKKCPECGSDMEYVDSPFVKTDASSATAHLGKVWKCKNPSCGAVLKW